MRFDQWRSGEKCQFSIMFIYQIACQERDCAKIKTYDIGTESTYMYLGYGFI